jgi:hypothetical protein
VNYRGFAFLNEGEVVSARSPDGDVPLTLKSTDILVLIKAIDQMFACLDRHGKDAPLWLTDWITGSCATIELPGRSMDEYYIPASLRSPGEANHTPVTELFNEHYLRIVA